MSKQYVFWRTSHGSPDRGRKPENELGEVLAELGRTSKCVGNEVQWVGYFNINRFIMPLKISLVVVDPNGEELNEHDGWDIIWKSVIKVLKTNGGGIEIKARDLIKEADARAAAFFRQVETHYVVVSSMSIPSLPSKSIKINGQTVFQLRKPERFTLPPALTQQVEFKALSQYAEENRFAPIGIRTFGRSVHDAFAKGFEALTLLRGIWSLYCTYGQFSMRSGISEQDPLGVIHTGPIHTIHHPHGPYASDIFWRELEPFTRGTFLYDPSDKWVAIEQQRKSALRRLRLLPYGKDLEDLIIRYVVALDQRNLDVTFLQLWSILEKITDTVGSNYDKTIHRAVWAHGDRKFASDLLRSIRLRRNRLVHASQSSEDRDQIGYMIKHFIDRIFFDSCTTISRFRQS